MSDHRIATREQWAAERSELLAREKELSRMGDELARQRRELPWVVVEEEYTFQTADGTRTLAELFAGRSQLIVYHFMFGPDYEAGCTTCSSTADSFNGVPAHLSAWDVTMICVSRAPIEKLQDYRQRMGWSFDWVSSEGSDFNVDYGVAAADGPTREPAVPLLQANELVFRRMLTERPELRDNLPPVASRNARASGTDIDGYLSDGHGVSVFVREGDTVYHCYSSYARGTEFLMGYYAILDRVPKGRNEDGPAAFQLRRHDEYETG
jgi:predicted dithiol-disulfide oxidoreductase (DUF899 family)